MTAVLRARGLSRSYGALTAVDAVDLAVAPGGRHALIGPNGAGKSTLLHLLAGNVRPSAGRVVLDGRDVTRAGPAGRFRRGLARTFQTPALLDDADCLGNMLLGAWTALPARDRLTRAGRRRVRDDHRARLDAFGLADHAGRPAGRLSHGRRRMLEIAVALAADPRVLLMDEPAAGLTDDDVDLLLAVLRGIGERTAVLLVEHHQDLVTAYADTVTVLHQGTVVAEGSPAAVAADDRVAAVYRGALGGEAA